GRQRAAVLPELSRSLVQEPAAQAARDRAAADRGDRTGVVLGRRPLRDDRHLRAGAGRHGGAGGERPLRECARSLDLRAGEPLRREVPARAAVCRRRGARLAAPLSTCRLKRRGAPTRIAGSPADYPPPIDRRISSRSLIRSRRAAALSNSSFSERSSICRRNAVMVLGISSRATSAALASLAVLARSTKSSCAVPSSAAMAFSMVLGVMPWALLCASWAVRRARVTSIAFFIESVWRSAYMITLPRTL